MAICKIYDVEYVTYAHMRYVKACNGFVKLKVMQPQPKHKTRNFPNLRKRLLRDIK